jgi:hypothetical protein
LGFTPGFPLATLIDFGAILISRDTDAGAEERLRQNAAEVIGTAISGIDSQIGKFSSADQARAIRLVKLLYGDARSGSGGVIARMQGNLWLLKADPSANQREVDQQFWATEEAIRKNWKWLRGAYLHGFNLSQIRLYGSDLAWADLGESTVTGARFCKANLYGADLRNIQDYGCIDVRGANIKRVQNAPPGFVAFAKQHGALELEVGEWASRINDPTDDAFSKLNCYQHDARWPENCSRKEPQF